MNKSILEIVNIALGSVSGKTLTQQACKHHSLEGEFHVVAIGKAAASMAAGLYASCSEQVTRCLLISDSAYIKPWH